LVSKIKLSICNLKKSIEKVTVLNIHDIKTKITILIFNQKKKSHLQKLASNNTLNGERCDCFPLNSGISKDLDKTSSKCNYHSDYMIMEEALKCSISV
jgi:hypothetical protein